MNLSEDLRSIYRDFSVGATFEGRTVQVIKDDAEPEIDPGQRGGAKMAAPQSMIRFITADLKSLSPGKEIDIDRVRYKVEYVYPVADGLESSARLVKIK